jgi:light-regulated signal transduction histidine kinase (bacteriophytochrome)
MSFSQNDEENKKDKENYRLYLSAITNEIYTPITVIRGYTEILLRVKLDPLTEDQAEVLKVIRQQSTYITHILNLAKITAGLDLDVYTLQYNRVILNELLAKSVEMCYSFGEKSIKRAKIAVTPLEAEIFCDKLLLELAFIQFFTLISSTASNNYVDVEAFINDNINAIIKMTYIDSDNWVQQKYAALARQANEPLFGIIEKVMKIHNASVYFETITPLRRQAVITLPQK